MSKKYVSSDAVGTIGSFIKFDENWYFIPSNIFTDPFVGKSSPKEAKEKWKAENEQYRCMSPDKYIVKIKNN